MFYRVQQIAKPCFYHLVIALLTVSWATLLVYSWAKIRVTKQRISHYKKKFKMFSQDKGREERREHSAQRRHPWPLDVLGINNTCSCRITKKNVFFLQYHIMHQQQHVWSFKAFMVLVEMVVASALWILCLVFLPLLYEMYCVWHGDGKCATSTQTPRHAQTETLR